MFSLLNLSKSTKDVAVQTERSDQDRFYMISLKDLVLKDNETKYLEKEFVALKNRKDKELEEKDKEINLLVKQIENNNSQLQDELKVEEKDQYTDIQKEVISINDQLLTLEQDRSSTTLLKEVKLSVLSIIEKTEIEGSSYLRTPKTIKWIKELALTSEEIFRKDQNLEIKSLYFEINSLISKLFINSMIIDRNPLISKEEGLIGSNLQGFLYLYDLLYSNNESDKKFKPNPDNESD